MIVDLISFDVDYVDNGEDGMVLIVIMGVKQTVASICVIYI